MLEAYDTQRKREKQVKTNIYAPESGHEWRLRCARGRRPLNSVYLNHAQKAEIIDDIEEYLAPGTAKWYSDSGIPYRRGFLFHG